MVKPLISGQISFTTNLGSVVPAIESKGLIHDQTDLLKKIDQQLNISKQMYPTSNM